MIQYLKIVWQCSQMQMVNTEQKMWKWYGKRLITIRDVWSWKQKNAEGNSFKKQVGNQITRIVYLFATGVCIYDTQTGLFAKMR